MARRAKALFGSLSAAAGGGQHQPEYLEYNSRDWTSRMFLNTGGVYLFGIATAGLYGAGEGWRKAAGIAVRG